MARWQPGSRERLQTTTLELFAEQGFEGTTVAEIAQRAGLTERTFFRYFTDKREVLFAGQDVFEALFVDRIAAAPPDAEPFAVVTQAIRGAAAEFFPPGRRAMSRQRQDVIDANPGLRERELLKLANLTTAIAAALRDRGVPAPEATLSADLGVTAFRLAFARWLAGPTNCERPDDGLAPVQDEVLTQLRALVGQ